MGNPWVAAHRQICRNLRAPQLSLANFHIRNPGLAKLPGMSKRGFYITTVYGFTMVYQCLSYHHSTRGSGQTSWVLPVRNACIPQVNLFDNHTQPLMKVGPRLTGRRVSSVTRGHPASMVVSKVSCLSNSSLKTVSVACPLILCCKTISS